MRTSIRTLIIGLAILLLATVAHAEDLTPVQVFTDGVGDGAVTAQATPAGQDLVAGFISETDETIDFTWQVADLPDPQPPLTDLVPGVPEAFVYYWDFELDTPDGSSNVFELSADSTLVNWSVRVPALAPTGRTGAGHSSTSLGWNCTATANVHSCESVPGAVVTLRFDGAANTITASVRRQDLLASDGTPLAVAGTELSGTVIFDGIASCTTFYVVISASMCDKATMDDTYIIRS